MSRECTVWDQAGVPDRGATTRALPMFLCESPWDDAGTLPDVASVLARLEAQTECSVLVVKAFLIQLVGNLSGIKPCSQCESAHTTEGNN